MEIAKKQNVARNLVICDLPVIVLIDKETWTEQNLFERRI